MIREETENTHIIIIESVTLNPGNGTAFINSLDLTLSINHENLSEDISGDIEVNINGSTPATFNCVRVTEGQYLMEIELSSFISGDISKATIEFEGIYNEVVVELDINGDWLGHLCWNFYLNNYYKDLITFIGSGVIQEGTFLNDIEADSEVLMYLDENIIWVKNIREFINNTFP